MKNNRNVFLSYFTRMSSREKHALEQQSLKDPFLSDALDGFQENDPALNSLKKLDKRYYKGTKRIWKISSVLVVSFSTVLIYLTTQEQSPDKKQERKATSR